MPELVHEHDHRQDQEERQQREQERTRRAADRGQNIHLVSPAPSGAFAFSSPRIPDPISRPRSLHLAPDPGPNLTAPRPSSRPGSRTDLTAPQPSVAE